MKSFESTYIKHRDAVLRFAIQCAGRREVAEELAAEAFLELHRNWDAIDVANVPSWLFTIIKNRAADYWRRQQLEQRYLASGTGAGQRPRHEKVGLFEDPGLKPVHRICLTLRYVHEMSLAEIAARMGLKEVQVKGHLQMRTLLRNGSPPHEAMKWDKNDSSPDESDFRRELEVPIARPVMAAETVSSSRRGDGRPRGAMPGQADAIEEHARRCAVCQQLSEDRRTSIPESRWKRTVVSAPNGELARFGSSGRLRRPFSCSPGLRSRCASGATREPSTRGRAAIPKRAVLALEQAPVRIPEVAVLTDRTGSSRRGSTLQALAAALQPYRAEDYSEAAQQLEALLREYPDSAEAAFYLGVCRLFLNDNAGALTR